MTARKKVTKPKKPPLRRIPSDDCLVVVEGEDYHPHTGEWVETLHSGLTVGGIALARELHELGAKMTELEGADDVEVESILLMDAGYQKIIPALRDHITAWSWTDLAGEPYPQPRTDPAVYARLDVREIVYLQGVALGQDTPANPDSKA